MRFIEKKRQIIINEMEVGRGSNKIFSHPVTLEPTYKAIPAKPDKSYFARRTSSDVEKKDLYVLHKCDEIYKLQFIRIRPSKEDNNSLDEAEQFILSLPCKSPISFEIVGHDKNVRFQFTVEESQTDIIFSQFRSHFPNADAFIKEDLIKDVLPVLPIIHAYRLKSSHFFPVCLVSPLELYRSLFGFLGNLDNQQVGVYQILFAPATNNWQDNMRQVSRNRYDQHSPFFDIPDLPKSVDKKISKTIFAPST